MGEFARGGRRRDRAGTSRRRNDPRRSTVSHNLRQRAALAWLPVAVLAVALVVLVYGVAQQGLRMGGDQPQLQVAEDAAAALDAGTAPSAVVPGTPVDIASSLGLFMVVTDGSGAVVAGNGQLDGAVVAPPAGVLRAARDGAEDRVTWQPRAGVRIAQVTVGWAGGAVTVGRSLREVERQEDVLLQLCAVGLAGALAATALASVLVAALAGQGTLAGRRDETGAGGPAQAGAAPQRLPGGRWHPDLVARPEVRTLRVLRVPGVDRGQRDARSSGRCCTGCRPSGPCRCSSRPCPGRASAACSGRSWASPWAAGVGVAVGAGVGVGVTMGLGVTVGAGRAARGSGRRAG